MTRKELLNLKKGETIYEYGFGQEVESVITSDLSLFVNEQGDECLEFKAETLQGKTVDYFFNLNELAYCPKIYTYKAYAKT